MTKLRDVKPCGHRVLVKLKQIDDNREEVSESGIVLAIKDKRKIKAEKIATQEAYVVELGENAFKDYGPNPWCKVGDLVLICRHSGDDLDDVEENETYRVINDIDVEAVFRGEELK